MYLEIVYLLLSGILLGLAWYFHVIHKSRYALALLLIAGALLRLYMASDSYLHAWDERYHALVAKNMMEHPFKPMLYKNPILGIDHFTWTTNHVWLHKQPLPLWCMSFSLKIFGVSEIALRLPSLLLSTLGIGIIYDLGRRMFTKEVAFFSAFLFAVQGLILDIGSGRTATDHVDLFFLFFVLLAVWSAKIFSDTNRWFFNVLCGIAIGSAILTKWLPALIVLPIWLLFQYEKNGLNIKKMGLRFLVLLFVVGLIAVPWQIYIRMEFPIEQAWENSFNMRHLTEMLDGMGGQFYYHFDRMRIAYGEIVYLPVLWFIYHTAKNRKIENLVLIIWLLIPYIFFSIARTKMQAYTLFAAPALLMICGLFWDQLKEWYRHGKMKWLIVLVMIALIALPVRYSIERIKPLDRGSVEPKWVADLKDLRSTLPEEGEKVLLNVDNYIECMFYNDVTAYHYTPSREIIDSLLNEGYLVYVNETPAVGDSIKGVHYLNVSSSED